MKKTFREVIANIKEGEVWECDKEIHYEEKTKDGTLLSSYRTLITLVEKEIRISDGKYFDETQKFKLVGKVNDFGNAFKAYEEGKMIQSVKTWRRYEECFSDEEFKIEEIRDKWIVRSGEWPHECIE